MSQRDFTPIHPGEILQEDFLYPMNLTAENIARAISVPTARIDDIVSGKCSITAETALRLGYFFSMEAQSWMNLQTRYDLEVARESLAGRLEREVRVRLC